MGSSLVNDKNDNVLPLTNNVRQSSYPAANSTYCGYTLETVTRAVESTIEIRVTGNIGDKRAFGGFDSTPTENQHNSQRRTVEPWNFGAPKHVCQQCGAIVWYEERNDKFKQTSNPKYSLCCKDGKIQLPVLKDAPPFLKSILRYNGGNRSTKFKENIRGYNLIFSFTSTGAKVDNTINVGGGPYVYRISGQNHHLMGSLLPATGEKPKFAQLYIYDTENEVVNRLQALSGDNTLSSRLEFDIVFELVKMFDECNDLAKVFRMARDRFRASEFIPIRLRLMRSRSNDSNVYNLPTGSEVAALIVGDLDDNVMRDIIVEHKSDGLQRISELHPSFMAMQYPLLFPYGEDGFQLGIKYITNEGK
ncbi:hypothetical protein LWI29_008903 [Acer saccharum]|uniref:Helitron helicase-like domain-containing protein n=1 Tax=Acer saccharum TaxID=4024 RepID=A0AA39VQD6_ACESA|nr:hypothetical protein LWI29_008903 [Acer saccharum]